MTNLSNNPNACYNLLKQRSWIVLNFFVRIHSTVYVRVFFWSAFQDKSGVNLFVKYKRSGTFKKANIITTSPLKVNIFVLLLARERERERERERDLLLPREGLFSAGVAQTFWNGENSWGLGVLTSCSVNLKRGYSPFCASVLLITKVGHQI